MNLKTGLLVFLVCLPISVWADSRETLDILENIKLKPRQPRVTYSINSESMAGLKLLNDAVLFLAQKESIAMASGVLTAFSTYRYYRASNDAYDTEALDTPPSLSLKAVLIALPPLVASSIYYLF